MPDFGLSLALVEAIDAALVIGLSMGRHMMSTDQHGMSHCDNDMLLAPPGSKAMVAGFQKRVFGADSGPGCRDHCGGQRAVAYRRAAQVALASALAVAGRQTGPGWRIPVILETDPGEREPILHLPYERRFRRYSRIRRYGIAPGRPSLSESGRIQLELPS